MNEYHQPSVTGHAGEKCSIVWYDNGYNILKVYYNGTGWEGPNVGATGGRYPNLSAGSTTAKYCWTSGTSSPYEIKVSSETLQRPLLLAGPEVPQGTLSFEHSRAAVLHDTSTGALFWAQLGDVRVKNKTGREILIPLVSYVDSLLVLAPENHFDYLRTKALTLSSDADSLKFQILVYSRGFKSSKLELEYKLVDATTGSSLLTVRRVPVVEEAGEFRSQGEVAIGLRPYRGRRVFIAVEPKGLGEGTPHILRNLGEIYRIVEGSSFGRPPEGKESTQTQLTSFALLQNYPNPGNPSTHITFTLPQKAHVTLEIYNLLGQRVRTLVEGVKDAGSHRVVWDGRDEFGKTLPSGVYLYRLRAGQGKGQEDFVRVKKMVLVR